LRARRGILDSMKSVAWAAVAFLAVSLPLVLLLHPVVDVAGPGWFGHTKIEFEVLKVVPVWRLEGRPTHFGVLAVWIGAGALAGFLCLAASISLRRTRPEGRGGAV